MGTSGERKKAAKGKGIRGSSKSGGQFFIARRMFYETYIFLFHRIDKFLEAMREATGAA